MFQTFINRNMRKVRFKILQKISAAQRALPTERIEKYKFCKVGFRQFTDKPGNSALY